MPAHPSANPKQFIQCAPVLHVPNVEATARYYRDIMGFTWDFGDEAYAVVSRDNSAIHFMKDDRSPTGVHLFQWVRDVDAYYDEITKHVAQIASASANQSYGIRELVVRDINGISVTFGQDVD